MQRLTRSAHQIVPPTAVVMAFVSVCLASGAGAAPEAAVRLANGVGVVSRPTDAPLGAALSLAVGSSADPAGREGLAELTARSLTAASEAHRASGDLVYRLASSVGAAELEVGDTTTTFLLRDVTDLGAALRLMTEALARPAFPVHEVLAARRSLHAESLEDLAGGVAGRRIEAVHALFATPSAWDRAWAIAALDSDDVRAFHAAHFAPSALRVAIAGLGAPELELPADSAVLPDLPGDLAAGLGAWTSTAIVPEAAPSDPIATPQVRLLTGAAATGVSLAVPARDGASFLALLAAAEATTKGKWTVRSPGRTPLAGLAPPPGAVLVAECETPNPAVAATDLLAQLGRLGKRSPGADAWAALTAASRHAVAAADRAAACLDQWDAGAPAVDRDIAGLLATMSPETLREAAAALVARPRALVAATTADDAAAAKAWLAAFPETRARAAAEPESATGRERVAEARAWIAAAVAAHGGAPVLSATGWTRLSDEAVTMDGQPKPMGSLRLDTSAAPLLTRHEYRPLAKQLGVRIVVLAQWQAERSDGGPALDPIEAVAIRNQLLRQPLALLQAAASGRFPVRSEGVDVVHGRRLRIVSLAEPDGGLTRLSFDEKTGHLVAARFRQRARTTLPAREVTMAWSDLREVEGVLVPFSETMRAGESMMTQASTATSWRIRREPFDPSRLSTSPDDLAAERIAK